MLEWLRRIVRKKMPYVAPEQAHAAKIRLSLIYAALAWNIIGLTLYATMKQISPETKDGTDYLKLLGVKDATVIKYSGFKKVSEFDVHNEDEDLEKFYDQTGTDKAEESS